MTDDLERLVGGDGGEPPEFEPAGEGYILRIPSLDTTLEVDFLRRESGQLKGEILVRCELAGARVSAGGILTVDTVNLSSARSRKSFAVYCAERARTKDEDWIGHVEVLAQRIIAAERDGAPDVDLRTVPLPAPDPVWKVTGIPLLARQPTIIFGDGATAKSYLGLYVAGRLAAEGKRVGFFDWELEGSAHRERLDRLFGDDRPEIRYARCSRPLVVESERLRLIARARELDYVVIDSVAFAADGPPEDADVASRFFQSLRSLGPIGSLLIAHTTKSLETADRRPFGSTFWYNGARAVWNVKPAAPLPDSNRLTLGLYCRKHNLGPGHSAVGLEFLFDRGRTSVRTVDLADIADLAAQLPVGDRLRAALRRGPMNRDQLRSELEDVRPGTLRQAIARAKQTGLVVEIGERLSLAERHYREGGSG